MKLAAAPFAAIESGRKTIELRLWDDKRQKLAVGDEIVFSLAGEEGRTLVRRVVALHRFDSFEELYAALPLERCGYTEDELATASPHDMERYYDPEDIRRLGVVGIELETVGR
jgi:ASC-1-like (ASCH) protein